MESWFCIWDDLANPNNGLNLVPNPLQRENDGRQSLRAYLPSAPGYAWRCVRPFQGQPTSPPWTHFFREKTPSETTTKPGADVMPHCRATVQQSTFVLKTDEKCQRFVKLKEVFCQRTCRHKNTTFNFTPTHPSPPTTLKRKTELIVVNKYFIANFVI